MQKSQFHDFISREVHTDQQIARSEAVVAIASKLAFKAVLFFDFYLFFNANGFYFCLYSVLFFASILRHKTEGSRIPDICCEKYCVCAFPFFSGLFRSSRSKTIMYVQ